MKEPYENQVFPPICLHWNRFSGGFRVGVFLAREEREGDPGKVQAGRAHAHLHGHAVRRLLRRDGDLRTASHVL